MTLITLDDSFIAEAWAALGTRSARKLIYPGIKSSQTNSFLIKKKKGKCSHQVFSVICVLMSKRNSLVNKGLSIVNGATIEIITRTKTDTINNRKWKGMHKINILCIILL